MKYQQALIDFDFAITQLAGDKDLLLKLLGKFKDQYANSDTEVTDYINSDDFHSAKVRIHTAKGITGSLGLKALFESCKKLDMQLKNQQVLTEDVSEFANIMRDTLSEIDSLVAPGVDTIEQMTPALINKPSAELAKQELMSLLSCHEFIDQAVLKGLVAKSGINKENAAKLISLVEGLEYNKAIALLQA